MAKKQALHERRGITFAELGALLGVKAMLQGRLLSRTHSLTLVAGVHAFDMRTACQEEHCGSVSCIGGTMAMVMGKDAMGAKNYVGGFTPGNHSPSLRKLFFPPGTNTSWTWITPAIAVMAIDNFLRLGRPCWETLKRKHG